MINSVFTSIDDEEKVRKKLKDYIKKNPNTLFDVNVFPELIWHDLSNVTHQNELKREINKIKECPFNQNKKLHILLLKRPNKIVNNNMHIFIRNCLFVNNDGFFLFRKRPKQKILKTT
ncbi:hypothetical protein [Bacillus cereus]|uniref:hypothetical protein n=1 Tax=Bacillus cereus group TaxID=86661 RepID=UPI0018A75FA1|nr:hypothetical protein [Bacillus cereus]MBF8118839.1 hypothetical protein [Bacillus cereus]